MKIFFSLNHFLPDQIAGTEIYSFNLAKSLQLGGAKVTVLVPFFDNRNDDHYFFEDIKIIRYSEMTESSRDLTMGLAEPQGLRRFIQILAEERPDIIHFHEIAGGRGVGMFHLEAAKSLGIKVVLTLHLSTYTCETGNLIYKEERVCDGIIRPHACSACTYVSRGFGNVSGNALAVIAKGLYVMGLDASKHPSKIGTALGYPFLIRKKKVRLLLLASLADQIVVLTSFYRKILISNGVSPSKITLSQQGLTGRPTIPVMKDTRSGLRLVFIGRVSKYKGVHLLLEALQALPGEGISLDIYGPVTEDAYALTCRTLAVGMQNVYWRGTIESSKVIAMLSGYDLLCLPSTFSEMSPLVIQEAFAAKIPVLASNVYGNAEQIQDGINGWLFDFKDVSSLKNKLELLLRAPQLIDNAKRHIPVTRSFEDVAEQHIEIYDAILQQPKQPSNLIN